MKKIYLFLIVFLLCGCSKKIVCDLNDEYNTKLIINYNKEKVIDMSSVLTFKTAEEAQNYCTLLKISENNLKFSCELNKIEIADYKSYMNISSDNLDNVLLELTNQGFMCE